MKTNKLIVTLLLSATLVLWAADDAHAARRWRRSRPARTRQPAAQSLVRYDAPYQQYRRYQWVYPQYIGAFHYRDLQHLGMPSGDRGLRGTPW
jgi:hypothetical protein